MRKVRDLMNLLLTAVAALALAWMMTALAFGFAVMAVTSREVKARREARLWESTLRDIESLPEAPELDTPPGR